MTFANVMTPALDEIFDNSPFPSETKQGLMGYLNVQILQVDSTC